MHKATQQCSFDVRSGVRKDADGNLIIPEGTFCIAHKAYVQMQGASFTLPPFDTLWFDRVNLERRQNVGIICQQCGALYGECSHREVRD